VVETELIGQALEGSTMPPLTGPAYMGVNGEDAPDGAGARMSRVMPYTGAAEAGLKANDVITKADGKPITGWQGMVAIIRAKKAGDTIDIEWTRGGETLRGKLTFGARGRSRDPKRRFTGPLGGQVGSIEQYQGPRGFEQGGVYRSDDAGRSWRRISSLAPRPFYFSQIRVNPNNPDDYWICGIQLHRTLDGGTKWNNRAGGSSHVDYHALWLDPRDPDHAIMGSDGGAFTSWDGGKTWDHLSTIEAGQFYKVALDNRVPFHCYGGLQDNGTWGGPSRTRASTGATQADWQLLQWGDGFGAAINPKDDGVVFATSQNGRVRKHNLRTGKSQNLTRPRGMKLRFNWNTPFVISPHDPKVLWVGASRLLRIPDAGIRLEAVSPEITRTERGSATVVAEDPLRPGRIWIGTDDGALRVSADNGKNFQPRYAALPGVPGPRYVSAIEPSRHEAGRVYVSLDGHRSDDFRPYVFVSDDAGATWRAIASNLPDDVPVRVVREDPRVPGLLYAGTETGVWVSRSNGERWERLGRGLPTVPVFDIKIHARDRELVAATHGRSLWIVNVAPLQDAQSADAGPDQIRWLGAHPVVLLDREPRGRLAGRRHFTVGNPPAAEVMLWLPVTPKRGVGLAVEVQDAEGKPVANLLPDPKRRPLVRGYNRITWDCDRWARRGSRWLRPAGKVKPAVFTFVVRIKEQILATAEVEVQADPGPDPGLVRIPAAGRFHEWLAKKQKEGGWKGH
ncbi:MAG: WD40/YVTN/BNR-like repeat-containing protein, partial [Planctomycetota bacterium]